MLAEGHTTRAIIGAFFDVYAELGFGFLEHVYTMALERELLERGLHVAREVPVRILYKGIDLTAQRIDLVVNERVIVEVKSTVRLPPEARRQVYNYLKSTNLDVGLLLHFGPSAEFHRLIAPRALPPKQAQKLSVSSVQSVESARPLRPRCPP